MTWKRENTIITLKINQTHSQSRVLVQKDDRQGAGVSGKQQLFYFKFSKGCALHFVQSHRTVFARLAPFLLKCCDIAQIHVVGLFVLNNAEW